MTDSPKRRRNPLTTAVAEHFPGRPADEAYLDTAAIGLVPEAARRAADECYAALGRGTRGGAYWRPRVAQAHRMLADEFGVSADESAFMASTSEAIIGIARLVDWRPGDEVIVTERDFPAAVWPWRDLEPQASVIEVAPAADDDRLTPLLAAIGPRTKVVSVTHVNSSTGTRLDLDALGRACHAVGALLVVDGAQAGGCVPPQLEHVDFYVCTGYKWMLAGFGVAAVIAKRAALEALRPSMLGDGGPPRSPHLTYGHANLPGICAFGAALSIRHAIGVQDIADRAAGLATRVHTECAGLGLAPAAPLARTGTLVCLRSVSDVGAVAGQLAEQRVHVAVRDGLLRISPHFYNSDDDIDALLRALAAVTSAPHAQSPR
jgi:cysteine desulfurase/selenocysteine lyase